MSVLSVEIEEIFVGGAESDQTIVGGVGRIADDGRVKEGKRERGDFMIRGEERGGRRIVG